tara:strand:+ start:391 stop:807 length:417 start_codon:yes stop_codon:yes gene_type:complete
VERNRKLDKTAKETMNNIASTTPYMLLVRRLGRKEYTSTQTQTKKRDAANISRWVKEKTTSSNIQSPQIDSTTVCLVMWCKSEVFEEEIKEEEEEEEVTGDEEEIGGDVRVENGTGDSNPSGAWLMSMISSIRLPISR